MNRGRATSCALAALALVAASCGDDDDADDVVTMVVYDSYPDDAADAPNPLQVALDEFTADTGIEVALVKSQDAGTMLSKAILTAGNPEGDVMWGVDNTLLSRAIEERVFDEYESPAVADLDPRFTTLVPNGEATPVDYGDVCVNFDIAALKDAGLAPPTSFEQLAQPEYASKLVVENAGTSSPGLAFLLASIAKFGEDGWEAFWTQLHDNGVQVVDGWNEAYYTSFTRAGGDRPLVVSYGSSPPFEVLYSATPLTAAPTGVVADTCFRQVEFAGVLRGTDNPDGARKLIDFLLSERYQREVAMNLFVFPANPNVSLDPAFVDYATIPADPLTLDPALIDANREGWIDRWTELVS